MKTRYIFGEWQDGSKLLTVADVTEICRQAEEWREKLARYPSDRVMRLLGRVRERWLDEGTVPYGDSPRKRMKEVLPQVTGFSPEMVELGLQELCWTLNPQALTQKIKTELRGIPRVNDCDWRYNPQTKTATQWHPLGILLHIISGNVFVGAAGSLVEGVITGNVTILKMSSSEKVFLPALVQSFIDCDEDGLISKSFAVIDYSPEQSDVINEFKKRVDGIVVWGGEEAVKAYRDGLPARTQLVVFGPKLSLALVTKEGFQTVTDLAERLAQDISIWDQNACTAPQLCFVEGEENAKHLAEKLAGELELIAKSLPAGQLSRDIAIEIRKIRNIFEVAQSRGQGLLKESARGLDWTVVVDSNPEIEPSPGHRTIRIVPFENTKDVIQQIASLRGYIQTVGLAVAPKEIALLEENLAEAGVSRIVDIGKMAEGEIDDPHDGSYDLPQLMHCVFSRSDARIRLGEREKRELVNQRLRILIDQARKSKFYSLRLAGLKVDSVDDLKKIAILTREEMENNMPPRGEGLSTGPYAGGYVSRSGGSTGEPKFSIYDQSDWEAMISHATTVFQDLGVRSSDRIANCFLAGDLYGSFVSFDHINLRLVATSFAFANNVQAPIFLDTWRKFGINVVEGVPTTILPLLRDVKRLDPSFTIEKVVYAGSPLSKSDAQWLQSALGASRVSSVIGANDGGQIAYQCEMMTGALHHTIDDFNFIEIVDNKGSRVPDGVSGRILITSLLKYAFPLVRYELGDQGRIVPGTCPCGRDSRILEYLGRCDDVVAIGLMNVSFRDLRRALEDFPFSQMQLVAFSNDEGESLTLKLEAEDPSSQLQEKIHERLLAEIPKLKDALKTKNLFSFGIEILKPGSLPRNPRSGKIKNLIDERL